MRSVLPALTFALLSCGTAAADSDYAPPPLESLPPLYLARGLPAAAYCRQMADVAERWATRIRDDCAGLEWWPGAWFTAEEGARIWRAAADARDSRGDERTRREALRTLIELVGWRRTITGELPPPVPLDWYEIKGRLP